MAGHAAHGTLREHPHGAKGVPGGSGLQRFFAVGQDLAERLGQDVLQRAQLRLQRLAFRLQGGGSGVGGGVRRRRHGQAAVGVGLGNGERGRQGHGDGLRRAGGLPP